MPWRITPAPLGTWRYQIVCPRCGLLRGWARLRAAERHIVDMQDATGRTYGEPRKYEAGDDGTCCCVTLDAEADVEP